MKKLLGLLVIATVVFWVSTPAQAALPQGPVWQTVDHAKIINELGQIHELPIVQPANAVAERMMSLSQCPNGHSCAWIDANYGSSMLDIVWSTIHGHCNNLFAPWQDSISSTSTKFGSGYGMNWYLNAACPSGTFTHYVQGALTNIPSFSGTFNDQFTSFWDNCCS